MHVVLDGRMIHWTGIGTYLRNLLKALRALEAAPRLTVVVNPGEDDGLPEGIHRSVLPAPIPVYSLKEQLLLSSRFREADLAHFPHFTVPVAFGGAYVVTVHDLVYFLFPDACPHRLGYWYARAMYPAVARRARLVITDSHFSKSEILKSLPIQEDRLRVIYPGVDTDHFRPQAQEAIDGVCHRYGIARPYLLYVGNHQPRKNLLRLVEAFVRLQDRRHYQLVIAGPRDPRRATLYGAVDRLGVEGEVLFTDRIPDEDLPALYAGARCFVFPSLYEGFGLPVLEAMACGAPVVAGHTTSVPEVVDEAGVLIDPHDPHGLAEAIERVLASAELREDLRERGLERARHFRWEATAKQTLDVYTEAVNGSAVGP